MFHLYYGNDLRGLAARLDERIAQTPASDLLTPALVLIPQVGMRRWLETELAEQRGIVANVEFRLPGEFIWQLLRANRADLPRQSLFDRDSLRWRLMALLAELAREPLGAPLARYLHGDTQQLKRLQLAREFSAALERYQAYRRDLLAEWEGGAEPDDWQAEAWRRLVRASEEPNRARLIGDFLLRHAGGVAPQGAPAHLSVFGCLNISPDVLRVLGTLAEHTEVDFHLPSPCREYWGDLRSVRERLRAGASPLETSEQPLLASWGRVGREFFDQVFSYDEVQPGEEHALLREPSRASLLGRLQADILELRTPAADERQAFDAADVSLRVHVCHSPLREVQVLHDRLLELFEREPSLQPRDIAVMMPDVAQYASAIDAVFGALAPGDARRIPYTIADRRAQDEHPIVEVFLQLLSLPTSRWGVNDLLDLLAVPALQRRLGLDADALDDLAHWLQVAGVRWGLDATTRVAFGAGDYRAFSWAEGIERLLIGYATGNEDDVGDIAPVALVEGSAATTLGQALLMLRELERLAAAQRRPHRAGDWQTLYQRTLEVLLPGDHDGHADRDERRAQELVRSALAALAEGAHAGGCDELLDWQTVRAFLAERLAEADTQQRFLSGGVSFCGMVPLRAIPFRVIAVLGLGDEAFPRREPASGISRLEHDLRHARRLGDRSVRDDDRYLFLQLLTSADDVLHLSYVGRDLRSGNAREPSALLAELLDIVARDYLDDARALVVEHPLQPFSRAVFDSTRPGVFTYRDEWRAVAAAGRAGLAQPFTDASTAIAGAEAERRLSLDRLIDFWRNPARAFLRDVLHLNLYTGDAALEDDDPLDLDALPRSNLKRALIEDALASRRLPEAEIDGLIQVRRQLPVGRAGADAYRQQAALARGVVACAEQWRVDKTPLAPRLFELELADGWRLDCRLDRPYREGLLHWTPGKLRGHHWLRPWIEYLALTAYAGSDFDRAASCAHVAFDDKERVVLHELSGLDAASARAQLSALVQGYVEGQRAPLAFFPKSAWAYVNVLAGAKGPDSSEERALRAAQAEYDSASGFGENTDAWIALVYRDRDPFADSLLVQEFHRHALCAFASLAGLLQGAPL